MGVASRIVRRRARALAPFVAAAALAASCAASAGIEVPENLASSATPTPVTPTAVPTPTSVATPTPPPTPTPLPTPTPTPTTEPVVATDLIRTTIDENFAVLDELGVQYSVAFYTDDVGYIEERTADLQLLPASNQKVVTALGALELLPRDFQFRTELRLDADRNVYLVAGGDPTLQRSHVGRLIRVLVDGLTVDLADDEALVVGDVVVDPSHFPDTRVGPGWPDRYVPADIGPLSSLTIDNNQHRGDDEYVADPDLGNAELVAGLIEDAGVEIRGEVRVGVTPPEAVLIAERSSATVSSLVDAVLGRSDNETAEALVRQIGLMAGRAGEIEDGRAVIYQYVASLGLELVNRGGDGSGLSRLNRLSARELVEVMRLARDRPRWSTILNGLADSGLDGALAARLEADAEAVEAGFGAKMGMVRAKTGTLSDVASLTGVLTTIDGVEVFFSFLINGEEAAEARGAMDQIIIAFASATLDQLVV